LATIWFRVKKAALSMTMNGALAGLVAITAPCAYVDPWAAIVIGIIGGIIVVMGAFFLDKIHVDDPVGAVPVHGLCGIWGTLAVGVFGQEALGLTHQGLIYGGGPTQLGIQILGSLTTVIFIIVSMGLVFKLIDLTIGLRVSREEEYRGLDIGEHGMQSYSGFQIID
jgi:Amt family ammonium transporter